MPKATDKQINGSHYADRAIQPVEYIHANELDFLTGNIVKYATRWKYKGQALSDLQKVIHYAELLIQLEGLEAEPTEGSPCEFCTCEPGRCIDAEFDNDDAYEAWLGQNGQGPEATPSIPFHSLKYETRD